MRRSSQAALGRTAHVVLAAAVIGCLATRDGLAQAPPDSVTATTAEPAAQAVGPLEVSPRGALLRALALPGWGHAAIGSHTRGGFYVGAQAAAFYTLARIRIRRNHVEDRVRFREQALRARLAAEGVMDPAEVETALDEDTALADARELLDARREQQEDLVALSLFLILLSGADAYVSAHLGRFPAPLDIGATPNAGGELDIGVRVALPN